MKYAIINTEFFSLNNKRLPIGTIVEYEEIKDTWHVTYSGHRWGPYTNSTKPLRNQYVTIKSYLTFIDMNNSLIKLLFKQPL